MTVDELDFETRRLIADIGAQAPGSRHQHLERLHGVVGAYSRAGRATPPTLRRLLEELTEEAIESRFENMPV